MGVVIVGVGQSMRGDDAAGLEAVELWQRRHAATSERTDVRVVMVEEPGLNLLSVLEGMDAAVIVDAASTGAPAGTLHRVGIESLSAVQGTSASAHSWGVAEVLRLRAALEPRSAPPAIRVLGIEASSVEIGAGLSDAIRAALPNACEAIQVEVSALLND